MDIKDLGVNWDGVREGAGKAYGYTRDRAEELYGALSARLDAMEAEKRRNLYIGVAVCVGVFAVLTYVYFLGRRAGIAKARKEREDRD